MMELIPWRPLREIIPINGEMEDLFDRFFGNITSMEPAKKGWVPTVDIAETNDAIVVNAEIPGIEPENIGISLSGDILTIEGEKKQKNEEKEEKYYRMERNYGNFSRSVRIPVEIQSEKINAKYKNGTLKITLPKKEEAKPREIKVEAA